MIIIIVQLTSVYASLLEEMYKLDVMSFEEIYNIDNY